MKLYRTRTQEEFDWLAQQANEKGYIFYDSDIWKNYKENTVVYYLKDEKDFVAHEAVDVVRKQYPKAYFPIIEVSELMAEQDPLAKKIMERNNKPGKEMDWTEEVLKLRNQGVSYQEIKEKIKPKRHNPIQPDHYNKGEIDLFESWYRTYPFNEFRAGMQMIAERYMRRDKNDRIEDLEKARYTLERLKEYEVQHDNQTN